MAFDPAASKHVKEISRGIDADGNKIHPIIVDTYDDQLFLNQLDGNEYRTLNLSRRQAVDLAALIYETYNT